MKRYLLFHGATYYPSGGWKDFEGSFNSIEEAIQAFSSKLEDWQEVGRFVWFHVVDSSTWAVVAENI